MTDFDCAVNYVLRNEGGISNNSHDNGLITNHGISLRFLKSLSSDELKKIGIFEEPDSELIRNLSIDTAINIYREFFWNLAPFEKIMNQEHGNYIFDMAVNMGVNPAVKCVQRACWAVLKKRDLTEDGILGEKTLATINHRCGFLIMPALRAERAGYYRLINAKHDEKEFINGWLNRAYCA